MNPPSPVRVAPDNTAALAAWDGDDGGYWADNEHLFDASVARYRQPFLTAAAIADDDQVLDVGCGNGETTRDAARAARHGSALGVDLSSRMVERARRRAKEAGLNNARFLQADVQVHRFEPATFSLAISRTGVMFFGDPVAALANVARSLRPDGRLALLVWQSLRRNHWFRDFYRALADGRRLRPPEPDAPGPLSWADPDRVHDILTSAGFNGVACDGIEQPMYFGATTDEAHQFVLGLGFAQGMLRGLDHDGRRRAVAALQADIDSHLTGEGVLYPSAAWIVTAHRDPARPTAWATSPCCWPF